MKEEDVKGAIDRFYEFMDNRRYLSDFFTLLDPAFEIRYGERRWTGWRGFEDHQEGKRPLFDEIHKVLEIKIEIKKELATAETKGHWEASYRRPPEPHSHRLKAEVLHTWTFRHDPATQHTYILSQTVDSLKLLEGELPSYL